MKTNLSENQIRARFSSRTWAVNLNINGEPVNHNLPEHPQFCDVKYWPTLLDGLYDPVARFCRAVEEAAANSLRGQTVLEIFTVERCDRRVIELLAGLLKTGSGMSWGAGEPVELNPRNLIVNLRMVESDPAAARVVERIIGEFTLSENQIRAR